MDKKIKFITQGGKRYKGASHFHRGRWYTGEKHTIRSKPLLSQTSYSDFPRLEL